ncbi:MAG TPA: hypothetical protein VFI79_17865 [Gemmatimonadales bacterium]|nr:hypothetical protein [Gemmatimonadales bacterium]
MGPAAALFCAALSCAANAPVTNDSVAVGSVRDSVAVGSVHEAASDSTKPIVLPAVPVSARRTRAGDAAWIPSSAQHLYSDDGSKLLLGDLRVTSPLPASADLSLYGLPMDQTARDYVWGYRIGGPATAVFGSRTKVNPDVVQIALHPFLMSHQFRDTNGSLELTPVFQSNHPEALSTSSDAIERRATAWLAEGSNASGPQLRLVTSLRQSDVAPFLKAAVPALKVIPRYLDSQTYASVRDGEQSIEGFLLIGRERGDWRETVDGVEGAVLENTRQNLAVVQYERLLPHDSKLTAGTSWEGDHVDSDHRYGDFQAQTRTTSHILNPRIVYSMRHDAFTAWLSRICVESQPGGSTWQASTDGGVESRATLGWFTLQPSLAFQHFHAEATILHGVTASVHPDQVTLTAGYGTYADYFVFHDGMFGTVFDSAAAQQPQRANHYVASIQYVPKRGSPLDLLRITAVRKDMSVDLWGARTGVRLLSWDCLAAGSGRPSWELACLTNDARSSDGPLIGMIPFSLRAGISGDVVRSFNVSAEANYRSGSFAERRTPGPRYGERFRMSPDYYVNIALNGRFEIAHRPTNLTVTIFNALALAGSRAELTVDEYGRRYDAPCWANIRLRYELW